METDVKKAKVTFTLTLIFSVISSVSISFISLTSGIREGENNLLAYCIAIAFWGGILLSIVMSFITRALLLPHYRELIDKKCVSPQRAAGIISFSANKTSVALYVIIIVGVLLCASDIMFDYLAEKIVFPVISVTILAFLLHCVIDGKCYKVYKYIKESVKK